jgi:hypothetical protein
VSSSLRDATTLANQTRFSVIVCVTAGAFTSISSSLPDVGGQPASAKLRAARATASYRLSASTSTACRNPSAPLKETKHVLATKDRLACSPCVRPAFGGCGPGSGLRVCLRCADFPAMALPFNPNDVAYAERLGRNPLRAIQINFKNGKTTIIEQGSFTPELLEWLKTLKDPTENPER